MNEGNARGPSASNSGTEPVITHFHSNHWVDAAAWSSGVVLTARSPVMSLAITVDGGINSRCSATPGTGINKDEGERVVMTPRPPTGTSLPVPLTRAQL